jgi:hypothetical protein
MVAGVLVDGSREGVCDGSETDSDRFGEGGGAVADVGSARVRLP